MIKSNISGVEAIAKELTDRIKSANEKLDGILSVQGQFGELTMSSYEKETVSYYRGIVSSCEDTLMLIENVLSE